MNAPAIAIFPAAAFAAALTLATPAPGGTETVFNVMDYGCAMNLATDDTTCVQNAVNAASAAGGGTVFIPNGNIRLGQINLPNFISVRGSAAGATFVYATNATTNVFAASFPAAGYQVRISELWFRAFSQIAGGTSAQTGGFYVYFNNCDSCRVEHVNMDYAYNGIGIVGTNAVNDTLDHLVFGAAAWFPVLVSGGGDTKINDMLTRPGSSNSLTAIRIEQTGGIWISNVDFTGCGLCLWVTPANGQTAAWMFIDNAALGDSSTGPGVYLNPQTGGVIYGFSASNSWSSTNVNGGLVAACYPGGTIDGIFLHGFRAQNNGLEGMDFQCGQNIRVLGGVAAGNSNPGAVVGGTAGARSGIHFASGVSHFTVINVTCQANAGGPYQKYCVEVAPGASDYYTIKGVDGLNGTTTGATVSDGGTGTHKVVNENF
jgi:hypothetical protein